ncbi:hypothetical protein TB1_005459 [Malus domestica]
MGYLPSDDLDPGRSESKEGGKTSTTQKGIRKIKEDGRSSVQEGDFRFKGKRAFPGIKRRQIFIQTRKISVVQINYSAYIKWGNNVEILCKSKSQNLKFCCWYCCLYILSKNIGRRLAGKTKIRARNWIESQLSLYYIFLLKLQGRFTKTGTKWQRRKLKSWWLTWKEIWIYH